MKGNSSHTAPLRALRFVTGLTLLVTVISASNALAQAVKVSKIAVPNAVNTFPNAVNKAGIVVGYFYNSKNAVVGFAYLGGTQYKVFTAPKSSNFTRIMGINDSTEVVGDFLGTDNFFHGYTLTNGGKTFTQFDVNLGSTSTSLFGVSSNGSLAGATGYNGPNQGFVDIGGTITTFYGSGTDNTYAYAINSSNTAVGQYYDSSNNSHCFSRAASGTITEIVYPGALQTACTGINDAGEISGWYENASGQFYGFTDTNGTLQTNDFIFTGGLSSTGSYVGFYYGPGTSNCNGVSGTTCYGYLATPEPLTITAVQVPKAENTNAFGINDSKVITGYYTNSSGTVHGMMISGKTVTNIDDPNAMTGTTFCQGINAAGQIVGQYTNSSNAGVGFLYSSGSFSDIAFPGAADTFAYGINNSGSITGIYLDSGSVQHGFLYNGSTYSSIDDPNGTGTFVWGINDNGLMTVNYIDAAGLEEADTYNGTAFTNIDVPGALNSFAHQLNKSGNVAMSWTDYYGVFHGAVLQGASYYLFDDYASGTGLRADGINDNNALVGRYLLNSNGEYAGFQATIP